MINVKTPIPIIYPTYDISWNESIQSKIKAPINSTEGSTEIMLMILKTQHDNQILMTNISKRLENIERQFNMPPSPIATFPAIPIQNEIHVQQQFDSNSSDNVYTLPEKSTTISEFFMSPLENDFQLQQFETNLNQQSYRLPVIQFLRQRTGSNFRETVRKMIYTLITKDFSLKFNRTGANNKYAFKLKLEPLIKEAIFGLYSCSEKDVELAIVRTLKEAKDRVSSRKK